MQGQRQNSWRASGLCGLHWQMPCVLTSNHQQPAPPAPPPPLQSCNAAMRNRLHPTRLTLHSHLHRLAHLRHPLPGRLPPAEQSQPHHQPIHCSVSEHIHCPVSDHPTCGAHSCVSSWVGGTGSTWPSASWVTQSEKGLPAGRKGQMGRRLQGGVCGASARQADCSAASLLAGRLGCNMTAAGEAPFRQHPNCHVRTPHSQPAPGTPVPATARWHAPALNMQSCLRAWDTRADQRGLVCSDSTWPTTIRVALRGEGQREAR